MPQYLQLWLPRILVLLQWVCGLGIAYAIATTTLVIVGGPSEAVAPSQANTETRSSARALPPAPSLAEISKRHLFGRGGAPAFEQASAPATPTRLPLTLEAIFLSSTPAQSSAIISQRGKPGKLYSPDDSITGNARLSEVEADRVILLRGGVREELAFKSRFKAKQNTVNDSVTPRPATRPETNNAVNMSVEGAIGPVENPAPMNYATELADDPDKSLEQLGVSENAAGNYRVGNTLDHPLLAQSGLQRGDVVLSVNGQPLKSVLSDRNALAQLASAGRVRIKLLRNGQTMTITSRIPQALLQ